MSSPVERLEAWCDYAEHCWMHANYQKNERLITEAKLFHISAATYRKIITKYKAVDEFLTGLSKGDFDAARDVGPRHTALKEVIELLADALNPEEKS